MLVKMEFDCAAVLWIVVLKINGDELDIIVLVDVEGVVRGDDDVGEATFNFPC
jgi:hypothetical protein